MSKNKDKDELLRAQINDIIEADIQLGINDYLEEKEAKEKENSKGFGGFVPQDEGKELNVKVSNNEVDKIMKEYKRLKRLEKSNIGQVKKMGLIDKNGNPL